MKKLQIFFAISFYITLSNAQINIPNKELSEKVLAMEYRIWNTKDSNLRNELIFCKALTLKKNGLYDLEFRELLRINNYKDQIEINYEMALNRFLTGNFNECYNYLTFIRDSIKLSDRSIFQLWLLTLIETNRLEECKKILLSMNFSPKVSQEEIMSLPVSYKYKSPILASRLSTFCPGLGQIYSGYYIKGITNVVILSALSYFVYYQFFHEFYFTGTIAGIFPFIRFYNGGKQLSYNLAVLRNEKNNLSVNQQFRDIVFKLDGN